jgi:hypothetical protein
MDLEQAPKMIGPSIHEIERLLNTFGGRHLEKQRRVFVFSRESSNESSHDMGSKHPRSGWLSNHGNPARPACPVKCETYFTGVESLSRPPRLPC